jgi:hypothetical protein
MVIDVLDSSCIGGGESERTGVIGEVGVVGVVGEVGEDIAPR